MWSAQVPASLPSSESAFLVVQVGSSGRPIRRRGPSSRHVGPVLLGSWWRSLSGPRTVRQLRPSGLAGSRARLSAARIGGGVIALEFVSPLIPIRLRVVLALPARRPPRTVRGGAARRAAPVTALLGPLAGCPRLYPA